MEFAAQELTKLLTEAKKARESLDKVLDFVDLINKRYGSHTIRGAACGANQNWKTVANHRSAKFTTAWNELLRIKLG